MAADNPPAPALPVPDTHAEPSAALTASASEADGDAATSSATISKRDSSVRPATSSCLLRYASLIDKPLLRLQRLLSSTAGLEMFLATINHVLYILATVQTRSMPGRALLMRLLTRAGPRSSTTFPNAVPLPVTSPHPTSPTSLKSLTTLVSDTRTTLRLTALLPLYSSLRALLRDNNKKDKYLRAISLAQCTAYIIFQFTENIAYLVDRGILSQRRLTRSGGTAKWWLWSSRAWLAGVSCDFLKLFREAALERERTKERPSLSSSLSSSEPSIGKGSLGDTKDSVQQVEAVAAKGREKAVAAAGVWWNEMFVASCWLPLCVHYSLQDGLWGVNNGVVGLLSLMASARGVGTAWARTDIS